MGSAIFVSQINHKYLMNKSKEDMASLTLWIVKLRNEESKSFDKLLTEIVQLLDDEKPESVLPLIKEWDKKHKPIEPDA